MVVTIINGRKEHTAGRLTVDHFAASTAAAVTAYALTSRTCKQHSHNTSVLISACCCWQELSDKELATGCDLRFCALLPRVQCETEKHAAAMQLLTCPAQPSGLLETTATRSLSRLDSASCTSCVIGLIL